MVESVPVFNEVCGQCRTTIEAVWPEIDGGVFPIKRVVGEEVVVEADIFGDGHDVIAAMLKWRHADQPQWSETALEPLVNDRWRGAFVVKSLGGYFYTIEAWVDRFKSWRRDLEKKIAAEQDVKVELWAGAQLIGSAASEAPGAEGVELRSAAQAIGPKSDLPLKAKIAIAISPAIAELMERYAPRLHSTTYPKELPVVVDPLLARFGAWYEMFPRSWAAERGKHGRFKDCEARLPEIAKMGFDVLYLAPIHPIGTTFRKGKNGQPNPRTEEPGSPWGIGSEEGGHKAIHPQLGTLEDFRKLLKRARDFRIQIALDVAFQCSPDHPWVREHPQWFRKRPDGSIQYAENPPKRYQDIYPLDFETEDWKDLWTELKSVFEFWIEQGVRIFRVDNPHTKPFAFWQWCLNDLKRRHPDLIFLAEAFTRPKVMYYLAKLGFTQSYNYFPWRNTKWELTQYFSELANSNVRQYYRPNLWPNTPDILTQYLQYGGRPAFMARLVLAATLGASYGIYGPAFELCENVAREPGSEEYLNSEKYEIRHWDRSAPGNLTDLIARINQIRRDNPALQSDESLRFHELDNEMMIAYSKRSPSVSRPLTPALSPGGGEGESARADDIVLVIVNLDPHHLQRGWITLDLERWGINPKDTYQVHDLVTEARYFWSGPRNYVELNPHILPAHILRVRKHVRREHDFDYFM